MVAPLYSELFPDSGSVNGAAHLIQMALTPVFMLSGIGTLINIFNTRLARVSDHLEDVNKRLATPQDPDVPPDPYYTPQRLALHQTRLRQRVFVLDLAIILNALGGAFTCGAAMALFLGTLRDSTTSLWMLGMFGAALGCTVGALVAFLSDTLLSWHGLRRDGKASLFLSLHAHDGLIPEPCCKQKPGKKKKKAQIPGVAGGTHPHEEADKPDTPTGDASH